MVEHSSGSLEEWLRSLGLKVDDVVLDGKVHRVDGAKSGREAGWYIGWESPVRACVAGDWSTGAKDTWRAAGTYSREDLRELKRLQASAAKEADREREESQAVVAKRVRQALTLATAAPNDHPYLKAKGIAPNGALFHRRHDKLYIPNADTDGVVWGAQMISADGKKFWHKGQRVAGTFFQIGNVGARVFVCEGFATGCTIHEVTGDAVACAFSANNLAAVAQAMRKLHPSARVVVAADNDIATPGNPGLAAARAAAIESKADLVWPEIPKGSAGSDFNDLRRATDADTVARQLEVRPMAKVTPFLRTTEVLDDDIVATDPKLSKSKLFYLIASKMNGAGPAGWPAFPRKFHYVGDRMGRKAVLEELADGIVVYRDRDFVVDAILQYCWDQLRALPAAEIDAESAAKCRNVWLGLTPPLVERPAVLLEKSQPGLTFKRLDFDAPPNDDKTPPRFESLLANFSNPLAVCAFIGSLFYQESYRQQYLYLHGDGGDGKGVLMRFLHAIFGDAAASLAPPGKHGDKFWNFNLYGKRLGLFYDCDDWDWFRSSHFKSLTGGDPIMFEEKRQTGFTDYPTAKFIASSNSKPNVSTQSADMRRLIFVSCKTVRQDLRVPDYEKLLLAEAEAIISVCKAIYLKECPTHQAIPCDPALEVALEAESFYLDLFHAHYEVGTGSIPGKDVTPKLREAGIRSNQEIAKVKAIWERVFGVKVRHGKRGAVYDGMKLRTWTAADGDGGDGR